jgi:hypothetical protein
MTKATMWKTNESKDFIATVEYLLSLFYTNLNQQTSIKFKPSNIQIVPVEFFVKGFQDSSPTKVTLLLSFLRIHLLNLFANRI